MKSTLKTTKAILVAAFSAAVLSSCGAGFDLQVAEEQVKRNEQAIEENVKRAEETLQKVDIALAEVDAVVNDGELEDIVNSVDKQAQAANIFNVKSKVENISDIIDNDLVPLINRLGASGGDLNELIKQIEAELATLDPSVPEEAEAIEKLTKLLSKINDVKAILSGSIEQISEKLEFVDELLDKLVVKIQSLTASLPSWLQLGLNVALDVVKNQVSVKIKEALAKLITGLVDDSGLGDILLPEIVEAP